MLKKACIASIIAIATPLAICQDHYAWQEKLNLLKKKCEEARAAKLAPIRERLAHECATNSRRNMSKEECRIETSTYGNNMTGARGATITGMYYDLQECQAVTAAMKEWEASKEWKN